MWPKSVSALSCAGGTIRAHPAETDGTAEQRARLAFVDVAELGDREVLALAFEVGDLAGDELERSGGLRDLEHQVAMGVARPSFGPGRHLEGLGEQRVAREHRDALAEDHVVRRLAATEIVVVHRRQVVVDERIGVDALDGAGQGHGRGIGAAAGLGRREDERRAHALAAGEDRVAHRLVDRRRLGRRLRQEPVERGIDRLGPSVDPRPEVERTALRFGHRAMFYGAGVHGQSPNTGGATGTRSVFRGSPA